MKRSSPKQLAIIIAFITIIIAGITQLILNSPVNANFIFKLAFSLMFVFISIYIIVYYMLNSFIFEKINPIYKTIHKLNIPDKELKKDIEERDAVNDVNIEVQNWANKKTKEIDQLKQMAKYRKEFLGNVSHELKTPIFNIQGYVLTLLDGGLHDSNINQKYLEKTEKSINRMISIVKDLEEITRLESGELELNLTTFNLVKLVEEVFESQELRAKKHNINLSFKSNHDKTVWVKADREQIDHLLTNLIVNSINYGKENDGITEISFLEMGENILTEIADNGTGISEKDVPRIFERFYRVDKSRSRDSGGTGLGLAIVKHIIEAHNQTINVRSTINKGTSFAFTLKKGEK